MNALPFLLSLDHVSLILLFWYTTLFDIPRYLIGAIIVAVSALVWGTHPRHKSASRRSVSVLLVGHNEERALPACVTSLWEQTIAREPGRMQVIVVDDGSADATFEIARALQRQGKVDETLRLHYRGGKSAGVNLAIGAARGDIVVIIDIDTTLDRDALEILLDYFDNPEVGAVSGNLGVRNSPASLVATHQSIEYCIGISLGRRIMDALGMLPVVSGAFGAFRRTALEDVGRQDVEVGEDADLTMKLRRAGWRIRFAPDARALTDVPTTLSALTAQRLRWDRGLITIWARKFRGALNPCSAAFRFTEVLTVADVLVFQIVLALVFPAYVVWLFYALGDLAITVFIATLAVYAALDILTFLVAAALDPRRPFGLIIYLPFYTALQMTVMRVIRVVAIMQELIFRSSYRDPYVPSRVMQMVEKI
jgi:cellulose synthase/poly-beta-1,6-N-acetylglucosamine synthase-like glycosyltransferase